jgi:single-strand DNA-binding protein
MNVNRVVLTGNLTADPELREFAGGNSLCRLRLACNTRRRQPDGTWGEKPNYFDVVVWGQQGQSAQRFLRKGSAVAVDGRLEWREWTANSGEKRQGVEIVAESLQFLDRPPAGTGERPAGRLEDASPSPLTAQQPLEDELPF